MPKVTRKTRAPKTFATLASFAEGLKVPTSTASGWVKHKGWKWNRKAPWPVDIVPPVLRWAADNLERGRPSKSVEGSGEGDDTIADLRRQKLEQEIRKLRAHADQAETALAKERGALLDAEEVEHEWASIGAVIRTGFENLGPHLVPLALAHGMPHESAGVFQQQIEAAVGGILRRLNRDGIEDDAGGPGAAVPQSTAA